MEQDKKKIGLANLTMMIFTCVFGFANTTVAYDQMGYASIIWYILAALFFFLPSSLMFAEYGSALKSAKGGIYSWLKVSIGEKMAFIGTFIWLCSWVVWMVSTAAKVWIPMSAFFFGSDKTQNWNFFGLTSTQFVGILAILWMIFVTYMGSRGVDKIAKVGAVGGTFVMILSGVFIVASLIIWICNHGAMMQPIHGLHSFVASPNPQFQSGVAVISFMVYAVFAYGGMESMGGVMDSVEKPEKTFPRALMIGMIVITVLYALMIFMWGMSTNWERVLGKENVNLGNISYALMNNVGLVLGSSLGLSHVTAVLLGNLLTRFTGLAMWLAYIGSFFVMVYSPIKSFIMGSDPRLWPAKMTKLNKHDMPAFAMWMQAIVICVIIFAVSFGGSAAQQFYLILTDMSNVATSAPYLFLVGAFPFFKKIKDLDRPFVFFKTQRAANWVSAIVWLVVAIGIIFTCLQPILDHDYQTAFWTVFGPIFFGLVAWAFYANAQKHGFKAEKQQN